MSATWRACCGSVLAGLLLLGGGAMGCQDSASGGGGEGEGLACGTTGGTVRAVTDGDTAKVEVACTDDSSCFGGTCVSGKCDPDVTVRFMGINAGEIPHGQGSSDLDECMGQDARTAVERLMLDQTVRLVFEPVSGCTEKYGRALAYLWVDGVLLQERLVEEGLTCLYWYTNEKQKQGTLYYDRLAQAEERAKALGLGIWSPHLAACGGLPFPSKCP